MEQGLEEALRLKQKELELILVELKQHDIESNVKRLKKQLPKQKRCIICTLKLPCKHFNSVSEMMQKHSNMAENPQASPLKDRKSEFKGFDLNKQRIFNFTVKYRGREWNFSVDPQVQENFLPDQRRQSVLSSIETYREMKLESELRKSMDKKNEEKAISIEKNKFEIFKKRYFSRQKEKIQRYKHELSENVKEYFRNERKNNNIQKEKNKKYYEDQKKRYKLGNL